MFQEVEVLRSLPVILKERLCPTRTALHWKFLALVSGQWNPPSLATLHAHSHQIPCSGHICDENQVEVFEAIDGESHSPLFDTGNSVNIEKYNY